MSAEGKKKRGEGGLKNAQNIPFRYGQHGAVRSPGQSATIDWSTSIRQARSERGAGSRLVQAFSLGHALAQARYTLPLQPTSLPFELKIEAAMEKCSSPSLR